MKKENIFYLLFLSTIFLVRTEVLLFPQRKIIIDERIIHHFWVGAIITLFVLWLPKKYARLEIILFSIGLGLIADELVYLIFDGRTVSDYWSTYSVSGAILILTIVFMMRKKLTAKFLKNPPL